MRPFRCVAGALLCCLVAVLLPATAQAQRTQGSPLQSAANYPYHCDYRWAAGGFGPGGAQQYEPQYIGPSTCSLWQSGTTTQNSHLVPGTGTVTKARVKSGPNPAKISIATVRMYEGRNVAVPGGSQVTCCRGVSETPPISPTPNAVTEIPVNFRVEAKTFDPNSGQAGWRDIVVVNAVEQGGGTLPIADLGGPKPFGSSSAQDPSIYWYFPKFEPSADNQNQWFAPKFEVLMNYDWVPEAAAPAPTPPTGSPTPPVTPACPATGAQARAAQACPATPTPLAAVKSTRLKLRRGVVGVAVTCNATRTCSGRVRIRTAAKKPRLLGSKKLSVKAGKTSTIRVGVAKKLRRLVKKQGTSVTVEVDLGTAGKFTRRLTLKR